MNTFTKGASRCTMVVPTFTDKTLTKLRIHPIPPATPSTTESATLPSPKGPLTEFT
jgi:hypothetical protein